MLRTIDFYFDVISPYSYLASTRIVEIAAKYNCELCAKPVLFPAILGHHGQKGPAEIAAKRRHLVKDMLRWAAFYNVPLVGPPAHPFNPLLALRSILAVEDQKSRNLFAVALLKSAWGLGKDLNNPDVIAATAAELNLDGAAIVALAQSEKIKKLLRENTEVAISEGIFGVPTFVVDGEQFWGNDRLDFLCNFLEGKDPLNALQIQNILARPSGADRKIKP